MASHRELHWHSRLKIPISWCYGSTLAATRSRRGQLQGPRSCYYTLHRAREVEGFAKGKPGAHSVVGFWKFGAFPSASAQAVGGRQGRNPFARRKPPNSSFLQRLLRTPVYSLRRRRSPPPPGMGGAQPPPGGDREGGGSCFQGDSVAASALD